MSARFLSFTLGSFPIVFPSKWYDTLLAPVRDDRDAELLGTASSIVEIVKQMQDRHRDSIVYLIAFLSEVASLDSVNKMTTTNLARCFAPTVLKPANEMNMGAMLNDVPVTIAAIKCLIEHSGALGFSGGLQTFR